MLLKADLLQHLALQMLVMVLYQALCGACVGEHRDQRSGKGVLNGYSSTGVSPWDSRMFGRLAMGFANVRVGTRVLLLPGLGPGGHSLCLRPALPPPCHAAAIDPTRLKLRGSRSAQLAPRAPPPPPPPPRRGPHRRKALLGPEACLLERRGARPPEIPRLRVLGNIPCPANTRRGRAALHSQCRPSASDQSSHNVFFNSHMFC